MLHRFGLVTVITTALAGATARAQQPLRSRDFGFGMEINTTTGEALQSMLVPEEVYRQVRRADLGDLRVFNAAGEEVPHAIRSLSQPATGASTSVSLPFFPVRGPAGALDSLSLRVKRSQDGAVVDIRSGQIASAADRLLAYIIDTSALERGARELHLEWAPPQQGFVAQVTVTASEDLVSWRHVAGGVALVSLEFQGHALERRSVELPPTSARFLRLVCDGGEAPFLLSQVTAELVPPIVEPNRNSGRILAQHDAAEAGVYRFDAGGPVPVDRIGFELPQRNTLVEAQLSSSASPDGPWRPRFSGLLYRIVAGGSEVTSPEIRVEPSRDRYWLLRVGGAGGGLGQGTPAMWARWLPEQLLFVGRGEPPFLLAYGSYRAAPSGFSATGVLELAARRKGEPLPDQSVVLGARRELGGQKALTPPPPPTPWRVWTLWGVLGLGVLLLGWMTFRLVRQLGLTQPPADGAAR